MLDFISRTVPEYCERTGNTLLAEPLNLLSNLAFFVSAFFVYRLYKSKKIARLKYWFLLFLLLLIGIGSSLWHSLRTPLTLALDAVPIFIFFLSFIYLLLRKLLGSNLKALVSVLIFFLIQVGVSYIFPTVLNGSVRHVVNAITFIGLGSLVYERNPAVRRDIALALTVYIFAIFTRSIDHQICDLFPVGTHFLWHILTAAASYFAIKTLLGMKPFVAR